MRRVPYLGQVGAVAAIYLLAAKLSLLLAIPPGYATPVWPPSGIALVAALVLGGRIWPGIWIGAALANLTVQASLSAATLIATGNTLEALAAAFFIQRFIGIPYRFKRGEDVLKFVALVIPSAAIAATTGVTSLAAGGAVAWSDYFANWWTWLGGDLAGMIIVTPLILSWIEREPIRWTRRARVERVCFWTLLLAVASVMLDRDALGLAQFPRTYLILPFIIWATFRFSQREVTAAIATVCAIAVGYTVAGRGLFASPTLNLSLLSLLVFVSTVVATGLVLAAVVGERKRAVERLRERRDELMAQVEEDTRELQEANLSIKQDLGARAQLEQKLSATEQRLRLLMDGIQDYAIIMLNPDGRVISWNVGAQRITGYKPEEITGRHFSCFYPTEAVERHLPQKHLYLADADGRCENEGWRVRKDGTSYWANVIVTALYEAADQPRGYAMVIRDLTDRKRVESLEQTERQINEFLAMLGHELRNPLAPIRNALDLMRINGGTDPTHEWARSVIDRQVTQLSHLVDDLLDVSRITSGKIVLQREPIELNAAVLRAVDASRPYIDARKQTLQVNVSSEPVPVEADFTRLSQVVMNLLNNAAKYTPHGGQIRISVGREGQNAVVRVRDTGIGMSAELRAHAFDLFVQGDRSLDRAEGGLGIGLTLVKRLIELHGGSVEALSDGPGQGSEFVFRLPLLDQAPRSAVTPTNGARSAPPVRRRILIVDDNRDSAQTMAALLQAWGHEVQTVYDGPAAVASASEFRPEAIFLDLGLPGMNGYDVAKRLRAAGDLPPAMLVAFTGYGQDEDRRRVLDAGFDHHLLKPVDPGLLEKIIDTLTPG
jgi:PAS domain S-box-containing protein